MAEDRQTEIEIALTHQLAAIDDLSAVVREQAERIDRLERAIETLARRLAQVEEGPAESPDPNAPPPHW